jgi:hypothetical protein
MGGFNIPANIDLDIVHSPLGYASCFLIYAFWRSFGDMEDVCSQIPSQSSNFHPLFSRQRKRLSFIWGPYAAEHGTVLI